MEGISIPPEAEWQAVLVQRFLGSRMCTDSGSFQPIIQRLSSPSTVQRAKERKDDVANAAQVAILWVELRDRTSSAESRALPRVGVSILGRGRIGG